MTPIGHSRGFWPARHALALILFFIAGLAISRLLYEATFPRMLFLAFVAPVTLFALLMGLLGWLCWMWVNRRAQGVTNWRRDRQDSLPAWSLIPFAINLLYLLDPTVNLVQGRVIFAASVWLTALFCVQYLWRGRQSTWPAIALILVALLPTYLSSMSHTVGAADTFEFQVVVPQLGIAHPTGYPLYLLLGRLVAFIPIGSLAWRVNLASTVFAIPAALLLYDMIRRLLHDNVPAILAAVVFGLTPVFWRQAIQAEVYALHALIVAGALWVMVLMLLRSEQSAHCSAAWIARPLKITWERAAVALWLLIGVGLTNHLTSLFLIPPAVVTVIAGYGRCLRQQRWKESAALLFKIVLAFTLPLLLYAYLPLRWSALHQQPMGVERFIDWVIGGRFQGALRLTAWLTDGTRYEVVGRLFLQDWGWINLALAAVGLFYLLRIRWRVALVLFITWLGFSFYALNYYVPDLAVFLIPAHLVLALFWGSGMGALLSGVEWLMHSRQRPKWQFPLSSILIVLLLLPTIGRLSHTGSLITASDNAELQAWGEAVLAMPLSRNAAILADSEKIAPLYYLQQAEAIRPDLDIMVLADEAAYRAELDARISSGQTVYLARFLPGLAGAYHLRSVGPLVEVSREPLTFVPEGVSRRDLNFGPIRLVGVMLEESSPFDPAAAAVTLYWQATETASDPAYVYLRWAGEGFVTEATPSSGQHPAGNYYPAGAWRAEETVPDFHLLPYPMTDQIQAVNLQVAVGPPFQRRESLEWQTVAMAAFQPRSTYEAKKQLRAQNGRIMLSGADFAGEIRPQTPLKVVLTGYGQEVRELDLMLYPAEEEPPKTSGRQARDAFGWAEAKQPFVYETEVNTVLPNGTYLLTSRDPRALSICGWLAPETEACVLGEVHISGAALPPGATNYDDKIALLDVDLPQRQLESGGQLPVNLRWQGLAAMDEDYTVFLQVLNAADQIVGQVDAWPLQGTFPTSEWQPGTSVEDPYLIQLAPELPAGEYRLQVGWYLLSTLQRLPVLDENGQAMDDKREIRGLTVPD